jgi:hypothetical protein
VAAAGPRVGDFVSEAGSWAREEAPLPAARDAHIDYSLDVAGERFLVHVPEDYSPRRPYGLLVYVHPGDWIAAPPRGWSGVLDERRLIFVAPENAGNDEKVERRLGLAVLAAEAMMTRYAIDPHRVYAAGWSGGARMAELLGFYQQDVFHGTVQSCGADFYADLPHVHGTRDDRRGGATYGVLLAPTEAEKLGAKQIRFALVTGPGDFRFGDVRDIYEYGLRPAGYDAKLLVVPGMGHENADADALRAALDFIDGAK